MEKDKSKLKQKWAEFIQTKSLREFSLNALVAQSWKVSRDLGIESAIPKIKKSEERFIPREKIIERIFRNSTPN